MRAIAAEAEDGRGIFLLGASGATQTAEEREADGHGRFTKHVLRGLRSGDADIDGDGNISITDLAQYVRQELKNEGSAQEPVQGGIIKAGNLILGSNRRKMVAHILENIRAVVDQRKKDLLRSTYRRLEDYIDHLAELPNPEQVLSYPLFVALKDFSEGRIAIEQVLDALRFHGRTPSLGIATDIITVKSIPRAPYVGSKIFRVSDWAWIKPVSRLLSYDSLAITFTNLPYALIGIMQRWLFTAAIVFAVVAGGDFIFGHYLSCRTFPRLFVDSCQQYEWVRVWTSNDFAAAWDVAVRKLGI